MKSRVNGQDVPCELCGESQSQYHGWDTPEEGLDIDLEMWWRGGDALGGGCGEMVA